MDIQSIKAKFQQALPGLSAQLKMAPPQRKEELVKMSDLRDVRESAVMIILFPKDSELHLLFIQRSEYDGFHSGQIAFPGGKREKDDSDFLMTAARETQEEVGIDGSRLEVLGQLSDLYIPPSNFLIKPYVAYHPGKPEYVINPKEVQSVLEIGLSELTNPHSKSVGDFYVSSTQGMIQAPYYSVQGVKIWGATAMILSELLELIA